MKSTINTKKATRSRPLWLDEEPFIAGLLHKFLDMLDKGSLRLTLKITKKTCPDLFDFSNQEDVRTLWSMLKSLDKEYKILTLKLTRNQAYQEVYENARIQFLEDKEELVREWLLRPALDPYALIWQTTLVKYAGVFEDNGEALREHIIRSRDHSPEQILASFANIGKALHKPMTLRNLSARCFSGDSKFLDSREELLRRLFPVKSKTIIPRPVLILMYLPEHFDEIIFIENQDSFIELAKAAHPKFALIYNAGYRVSASYIRESGKAVFNYLNPVQEHTRERFYNWWFHQAEDVKTPLWFWGDMDYSGFSILKAMRETFPALQAWSPGYKALLTRLENGDGHAHSACAKEKQLDPMQTGCHFTDEILLPATRESNKFIDQEAILVDDLDL